MKIFILFYGAMRDLIIRYLPNFHKKIILSLFSYTLGTRLIFIKNILFSNIFQINLPIGRFVIFGRWSCLK